MANTSPTETPITWDELIRRGLVGYGFRAMSIEVEFEQGLKQRSNFPTPSEDTVVAQAIMRVLAESDESMPARDIAAAMGYKSEKGRFHGYLRSLVRSGRVFHEHEEYTDDPGKFMDGNQEKSSSENARKSK